MDYQTVMAELKRSGTAQARKIYARHGVRGDQFGVSYAVLGRMKKQIKELSDQMAEIRHQLGGSSKL